MFFNEANCVKKAVRNLGGYGDPNMPYYVLQMVGKNKSLSTPARDHHEALSIFGKELGVHLSVNDSVEAQETYLMDEWEGDGPHWVNPTIAVYATPLKVHASK
jgi:hypothetical protein